MFLKLHGTLRKTKRKKREVILKYRYDSEQKTTKKTSSKERITYGNKQNYRYENKKSLLKLTTEKYLKPWETIKARNNFKKQ